MKEINEKLDRIIALLEDNNKAANLLVEILTTPDCQESEGDDDNKPKTYLDGSPVAD